MANLKPKNYCGLTVKELMAMNDFKEHLSRVVPIIFEARMKSGFANSEKWQQMQVIDEAGGDINQESFSTVDIAVYINFLERYNDQYRGKIQSRVRNFFPHWKFSNVNSIPFLALLRQRSQMNPVFSKSVLPGLL